MALWDRITSRGLVEDRRAMGPVIGGVSITGLALLFLFNYLLGGDVTDVLTQINTIPIENQQAIDTSEFEGADTYEVFASTVLGSNDDLWRGMFEERNRTYEPPRLVLFRGVTSSSCGTATAQVGPHYCPYDETIYLDETFFDELQTRFDAQGGDVAEAYVIAHEAAHHVQHLLGILGTVQELQAANPDQANELSIKLELQADCLAGIWASSISDIGVLEPGEIGEAMDAAAAVGDDRIQDSVTGQVNPERWTHGSSDQRVSSFTTGYEQGTFEACDTF